MPPPQILPTPGFYPEEFGISQSFQSSHACLALLITLHISLMLGGKKELGELVVKYTKGKPKKQGRL